MRHDNPIMTRLTKTDLKTLPAWASKQLQSHLDKLPKGKGVSPTGKVRSTRVCNAPFCPWPSQDPAVWLHQLLVRRFGQYVRGDGSMVHEVSLDGAPKRWRYDHLMVPYRVLIEFNGYEAHGRLQAFKRDHEKREFALTQGFVVFDVTNAMLRSDPDNTIRQLESVIAHRPRYADQIESVGYRYCRVKPINIQNF